MDHNQNPYENGNTTGFPPMQEPAKGLDNGHFAGGETQNFSAGKNTGEQNSSDNFSNPDQNAFPEGQGFAEGMTQPQSNAGDENRILYSGNSNDQNSPAAGSDSGNNGAQGGNASYQYVSGSGMSGSNAQNPYIQNPYVQNGYTQNANTQSGYNQQSYSSNGYQQNPYMQGKNTYQPSYQPSYQPETEEPVSLLDWVGTILLGAVPCVGLIVYIIWAFSNDTKKSKANYCKAYLIIMLGAVALYIIIVVIMMGAIFSPWYY